LRYQVSALLAAAALAAATQAVGQDQPAAPASTPPVSNAKAPAKAPTKPAAAPAAKKSAAPKTVDEVTVTGASQSAFRSSIDRRSYGVANDLAATTGTISDALKNIPSVEVDLQGNVSLRGDTNVTILVDGKPSALFRGQSAAQALQSLPADSVERVEVLTNPSAEFSPEGSAGIINLVMKKTHRAGTSGSARYTIGTAGLRNGGVSGAYNANDLTISGDAGFGHIPQHVTNHDDRAQFDAAGNPLEATHLVTDDRGMVDQWNSRVGADYDLSKTDRLTAELHANQTARSDHAVEHLQGSGSGDDLNEIFDQSASSKSVRDNRGAQASWRRVKDFDSEVSASVSHETTYERNEIGFTGVTSVPEEPDVFQDIRSHNILNLTDLRVDLKRPMFGEGKLKAGYDLRIDDNSYDNVAARGVSAAHRRAGPDPDRPLSLQADDQRRLRDI
jgi:outer membrane receptor for ferrienterochelin and colicin